MGTREWLEVYGETEPRPIPLEQIFATEGRYIQYLTAYLHVGTLVHSGLVPRPEVVAAVPSQWRGGRVKDLQAAGYRLAQV